MSTDTALPRNRLGLPARYSVGSDGNGIFAILALVFIGCLIVTESTGGDFLTQGNMRSILVRSVALGIVAVGQTVVILSGSLDLSVAYMISAGAVLAGFFMDGDPSKVVVGVVLVLLVGVVVGWLNGLVITHLDVHPFIATLAMGLLLKGLLSAQFANFSNPVPEGFSRGLGYGLIGPFPIGVLLLIAVAGVVAYLLRSTPFGAHLYATGGDQQVARLSGVRVNRMLISSHIICSVLAVITGLYLVARLGSGAPWIGPDGGYDLESIAAVVLGGTALSGGRGRVLGTVAAVLILAMLDNLFNHLQLDSFLKEVVRGLVLIAAVAAYSIRSSEHEVE